MTDWGVMKKEISFLYLHHIRQTDIIFCVDFEDCNLCSLYIQFVIAILSDFKTLEIGGFIYTTPKLAVKIRKNSEICKFSGRKVANL